MPQVSGEPGSWKVTPADDRNMPVVGIAGVGDKQVLATADGFAHARAQLAGGRVVEHQFKFSVLLRAPRPRRCGCRP